MQHIVLFALLVASALAVPPQYYSFSESVGQASGKSYSLTGEGRITAVRVWESYHGLIYGFQFRYGFIWSDVIGSKSGTEQQIELHDNEAIIQVSGKYTSYLQSVVFTTSKGRTLSAGQPSGRSYNMYPAHKNAELRFLSGRHNRYVTSISAHWAVVDTFEH